MKPISEERLTTIEELFCPVRVQAGQLGPWYAGAPYSHKRFAPIMRELAEIIRASRVSVNP